MQATWFDVRMARRAPGPLPGHQHVATRFGRFHLRDAGYGQTPILIANDAPNTLLHAGALVDALATEHRVIVLELMGTGRSQPEADFDHRFSSHASAVGELVDVLKLPRVVLAFPCISGLLACELAVTRPEQVAGLVLMQTPTWSELVRWAERMDPRRLLRTPWLGQLFLALMRRRVVQGWYRAALERSRVADFTAQGLESARLGEAFPLATLFQRWEPPRQRAEAPSQPALVLWGLADRTHKQTDRRATLELAPKARYVEWPEAGHSPELERPEAFAALVKEWWREHAIR